ncbi:MAG: adenylate kinase [Candidatus Binatia bacterium]
MRVVLLGPPGAGKGTQAKLLEGQLGVPHVSTGDILRKAVSDKSPIGKKAAQYMDKGKLVPDNLILELMGKQLSRENCRGDFVLDGFPRTIPQASGLEELLKKRGLQLEHVLFIQVPLDAIIRRLAGRRTCRNCGKLYHLVFDPPSREGICDRCHNDLYQRKDDKKETIAARHDVYQAQTAPLVDYYRKRGLLQEIDGQANVEEIKGRIFQALGVVGA